MRQLLSMAAILCLTAVSGLQGQEGPYHAGPAIQIGGEGGWDYLSVDSAAHRLYVSHATHVVVIDTQTNKVVGDIPDTPGVHGFAAVPELGKGFSSNGRENKVSVVDLKTLKLIQKIDTGENPDWIVYEPSKKEVYTMNGRGKSASVIDTATMKVVATIPLEGKPETAMVDAKAGKIYVNMEDLNSVKVVDIATHKVSATWPAAPCEAATGHGDRPRDAPPVPRLRQQADGDDGQHQRQGRLQRAGRRRRRRDLVRPADQARVHLERRRRHGDRRARRFAVAAQGRADDQDRPRRADDDARSGDAHDLSRGDRLRAAGAGIEGSPEGGRRHASAS